jgi:hypothetical protein
LEFFLLVVTSAVRRSISESVEIFEDTFTPSDLAMFELTSRGLVLLAAEAHRAIQDVKRNK